MKALAEDRIVLTLDLDFGDLAVLTREPAARVILFRLENTRTISCDRAARDRAGRILGRTGARRGRDRGGGAAADPLSPHR
jgi:hypothetical protein